MEAAPNGTAGSTDIPAEGSAGIAPHSHRLPPHRQLQGGLRAQGTSHVPVDASPLGPLPSPLSRPEVADNIWSWQPLSTATTVSAVLVEEEVVEEEEDYHSV